jgi:tetratricopeptide (TPR) repeat protein
MEIVKLKMPLGTSAVVLVLLTATGVHADDRSCDELAGRVISARGGVWAQPTGSPDWQKVHRGARLCQGDTLRSSRRGRAAVRLVNDSVMRLSRNSTLELEKVEPKSTITSFFRLITGAIQSFSRKPRKFRLSSPIATIGVRGTEFYMSTEPGQTEISVLEGQVDASNDVGEIEVAGGQTALIRPGQAPQARLLVRPLDRVQWALFYPPVLAAAAGADVTPADIPREIERALRDMARNDPESAFDALERTPDAQRDATFHVYRAALALSVGLVEESNADIARALELDPGEALGYALRAITHVTQNRPAEALADGERAVQLGPSPASFIALSYAQQAGSRIPAARDSMLAAVEQFPEAPLAWARLGELQLMLGERARADAAASRAADLAPGLSRTQLVVGFAELSQFRGGSAAESFRKAIDIAPDDPLAHLGLGLAMIAQGDLDAGSEELEAAVALDSGSALLRAYLGKAYFSQKRHPLDEEQFSIAQSLDPNDPTAHLYEALLMQALNRPVEALEAMERSIALNDNRAVYRGRLLLDKDRAARSASLARVHDDLGFDRLAVNQATDSLATDPANASAHRFLSDSYRSQPRREVARVSELFQSQMLQESNINPVQPSIASPNLSMVSGGGPATPGFNEFTPLFERNQLQLNGSAFAGSNHTLGYEAVVSGVFDFLSFSGGAFDFDSDGFRDNADLEHHVRNAFAQVAITPTVSIQAEIRDRHTDHGDIDLDFDPDRYRPDFRRTDEELTGRVGVRISPTPSTNVLLSAIHGERERGGNDRESLPPTGEIVSANLFSGLERMDESRQYEALFTHDAERFSFLGGAAYSRVKTQGALTATLDFTVDPAPVTVTVDLCLSVIDFTTTVPAPPGGCAAFPFLIPVSLPLTVDPPPFSATDTDVLSLDDTVDDYRVYGYGSYEPMDGLVVTAGVNFTDVHSRFLDVERTNPKLGLRWEIGDHLLARAAYFESVKPVLASNRVLEPTQIAGFNQFFDDADTSLSTGYGAALEWRAGRGLYAGVEMTARTVDHPTQDLTRGIGAFENRHEQLHRAYVYWAPSKRWALGVEGTYDRFTNSVPSQDVPRSVITRTVPLKVSYFHPAGPFGGMTASYVNQKVARQNSTLAQGRSSFGVVDLFGGYRLPGRLGILSATVHNLFDRSFRYQDDSYRTFGEESSGTGLVPERTFMGRLTLSY